MKKRNVIIIIVGLALLGTIGAIFGKGEKKTIAKAEDKCTIAFVIAKPFVKAALEAPETASFPTTDFKCKNEGDDIYFLQSYVECKNLNNVPQKKTFQITLKFKGGNDADNNNWQLIKLNFLN